jgi:hypothetical protein
MRVENVIDSCVDIFVEDSAITNKLVEKRLTEMRITVAMPHSSPNGAYFKINTKLVTAPLVSELKPVGR